MDTLITIVSYASFVIAGVIVALNAIAPLTKTEWDNRALKVLVWIHDVGFKLVLPAYKLDAPKSSKAPDAPAA